MVKNHNHLGVALAAAAAGVLAAVGMLMLMLVLVEPAGAAFPGQNGKIVFSSQRAGGHFDSPHEIYTMNSNGTGVVRLTNDTPGDFVPDWQPLREPLVFPVRRPQP